MTPEFKAWPKIARWERPVVITEKIDGTNACIIVPEDPDHNPLAAQSRKRIITPADDNFGFAAWVAEHANELGELGPGYHFGEWYGLGIQRGYGLDEKRFALFNADRWTDERPACCDVVPVLERCSMSQAGEAVDFRLGQLFMDGSALVPGFMRPEGVVAYHYASNTAFKKLLENDETPKAVAA